jgi:hypothetical protein
VLVLDVTSVLGRIVVGPVGAVVDVAPAGELFLERGVNGTVPRPGWFSRAVPGAVELLERWLTVAVLIAGIRYRA